MESLMRWKPLLLSAVIAGCLLAQVAAMAQPFVTWHHDCAAYLWPFVDYPMFGQAYGPEDAVNRYRVIGYAAGEAPVDIRHKDLGIPYKSFMKGPVGALLADRPEQLQRYLAIYETKTGRRLDTVDLINEPVVRGPHGLQMRPPYLVNRMIAHHAEERP